MLQIVHGRVWFSLTEFQFHVPSDSNKAEPEIGKKLALIEEAATRNSNCQVETGFNYQPTDWNMEDSPVVSKAAATWTARQWFIERWRERERER